MPPDPEMEDQGVEINHPLRTAEDPARISTTTHLRAAFDAADPYNRVSSTPRIQRSITFKPAVDFGPKVTVKDGIYEGILPFPNQNYKPRKPILKKRLMSNCPSLYSCYGQSKFTDLVTKHNTMANSGDSKIRVLQKAYAVKVMRQRSLGNTSETEMKRKSPLSLGSSTSMFSAATLPTILDLKIKPPAPPFPVTGIGHSADAALVEHAGRVEHPELLEFHHQELDKQLHILETEQKAEQQDHVRHEFHLVPIPPSTGNSSEPTRHELTLANVAKYGTLKLDERKNPSLDFCAQQPRSSTRSTWSELWRNYHKITYSNARLAKLKDIANGMLFRELQYRIPVEQHAKKMADMEQKADEELEKFHRKLCPRRKYISPRKLGESITDPFGVRTYKKLLQENAKTGHGVENVAMPEAFATIRDSSSFSMNYEPKKMTVTKVSQWLQTQETRKSLNPVVWLQPSLPRMEEEVVSKLKIKKLFNVLDGRVVYPFFDPAIANSFARRISPISDHHRSKEASKLSPFRKTIALANQKRAMIEAEHEVPMSQLIQINPSALPPLIKDILKRRAEILQNPNYEPPSKAEEFVGTPAYELVFNKRSNPRDKFFTTIPLIGFQNQEISFEYMDSVIYITARTLTKYATERCKRRYETAVRIPDCLIISDLEYARDQNGVLYIEELSDEEKARMDKHNHLYAKDTQSIRKLYQ